MPTDPDLNAAAALLLDALTFAATGHAQGMLDPVTILAVAHPEGGKLNATLAPAAVSGSGHVDGAGMVSTLGPATCNATTSSAAGTRLAAPFDALVVKADGLVDGQAGLGMTLGLLAFSGDAAVLADGRMAVRLDRLTTPTGIPAHPMPAPDSHVLRRPYLDRTMRKSL